MDGRGVAGGAQASEAERVYAEHCARLERGERSDFEALCAAHPDLEPELRRHDAELARWLAVVDSLGRLEGSTETVASMLERMRARGGSAARLRIEGELGRGGMGAVKLAWDADLERLLAVKVALPREEDGRVRLDGRRLARFFDEAQVTAQLDHPGIVPVHDAGVDERGEAYFTMRLVQGEDLRSVFARVGAGAGGWNLTRALGVMLKVCEAMSYAHHRGVLHRDLKPANIMVGAFGEVYVMDWGLARVEGRRDLHDLRIEAPPPVESVLARQRVEQSDSPLLTCDGQVIGTPAYMAPEQARGELDRVDRRADIYSVGAILYHLLAGRAPYEEPGRPDRALALLERVRTAPPRPLEELAPDTTPELAAIVERSMHRDPALRYQDMSELAEDLRAYLEGRVVKAHATGTWAETRKWIGRNRALALSVAATMLAMVAGVVVASIYARQAQENADAAETERSHTAQLNAELVAQSRDLKLRGLVQDLARLRGTTRSMDQARSLGSPASRWWVEEARRLVDGGGAGGTSAWVPGLADVRARLSALREQALPYTEADRLRDYETHPSRSEMADRPAYPRVPPSHVETTRGSARERRLWQERMLGLARWPAQEVSAYDLEVLHLSAAPHGRRIELWRVFVIEPKWFAFDGRCLGVARELVEQCDEGERALARCTLAWVLLRSGMIEDARAEARRALAIAEQDKLAELVPLVEQLEAEARRWDPDARAARLAELAQLRADVAAAEAAFDAEQLRLRELCAARRTWRYADRQDQWWHDQLAALEADLLQLQAQLGHAEASVATPDARRRWDEAVASIAASPRYAGCSWPGGALTPQLGLLPLGPDAESGLWEFVLLQTGVEPRRGADGRWRVEAETGLVFVLLPRGRVPVEEQGPGGIGQQLPLLCTVELAPFFLAKHEMTQAQWNRVSEWIARHDDPDPRKPANYLSWQHCQATFARMIGWIDLPTDAQWEYGCRAGTSTPWSTGADPASLAGAAQIDLDGTGALLLPAGTLRPNAFGLHDMHGNVWEWCRDTWSGDVIREGDGDHASDHSGGGDRVFRGGSHRNSASFARSGHRFSYAPGRCLPTLGLRPAMAVTP